MRFDLLKSSFACLALLTFTSITLGNGGGGRDSDGDRHDGSRKLRVFDSRGTVVGPLVTASFSSGVVTSANGTTVVVPIKRMTDSGGHISSSQYAWAEGKPWYPRTDCNGPPAVGDIFAVLRPVEVVRRGADVTAYIASDTYTASADLRSYSIAPGQCTAYALLGVPVWMAASAYALMQYYPEPLTVRY
ncbi:hypothetical protein AWB67_07350 [Caballeronia terrestris]|uniref:Uncharacterized protein n=2 Tax=Caballeronia TaxID=1827195 RepID=A0A158L3B3_9BURK|nr:MULTISPECIES: hypothetical protein [Caballeronia]SAL69540.1 hypothetical protein AWB65_06841 [Caballeronia humi]SAL87141.1 hypothetical protein AWB67_07350 [Caballeronia terrestris]